MCSVWGDALFGTECNLSEGGIVYYAVTGVQDDVEMDGEWEACEEGLGLSVVRSNVDGVVLLCS